MKKSEIKIGGLYVARVSGKLVTVRVDGIRECGGYDYDRKIYDVTNLATRRKLTFRSAQKFRYPAKSDEPIGKVARAIEEPSKYRSVVHVCKCGTEFYTKPSRCPNCGVEFEQPSIEPLSAMKEYKIITDRGPILIAANSKQEAEQIAIKDGYRPTALSAWSDQSLEGREVAADLEAGEDRPYQL